MSAYQPPEPPSELPVFDPRSRRAAPAGPAPYQPLQPLQPVESVQPPLPPFAALPMTYPYAPYQRQDWTAPPIERPKRDWSGVDRVLSITLLGLAVLGALVGVATAILLPIGMHSVYDQRGETFFESSGSGHELALLLWSHVLLFLAAVGITVLLLRRRVVAFYIPLVAGLVAAVIFWVVVASYLLADHTMTYVA